MRANAPMLLRPELLDSSVSWSAQVTINHFIGNANSKVYNLVACLVVLDADTGGAWLTYGPTTWSGLFNVYSEAKSNDANAFGGVGLLDSPGTLGAGEGTYRIDWNAKLRRFEAYSKLKEADTTWWGPAYWTTQQVNTIVAATWGMRQPSRFRIGLSMRSWANATTFSGNGGRLYSSFKNFAFTTAPDAGAKTYFHSTQGTELSLTLAPPRFLPYTFAVAARGVNGTLSPFTPASFNGATASGTAVLPFRGTLNPTTQAKLNATASQNGYWWDFSAERPQTRSVNFVRDRTFHRSNYLVQDTTSFQPTIDGSRLGDRSALVFNQDSFLEALPFFNYAPATGCCGYTISPGGYNWLNVQNQQWRLFVVLRIASVANANFDILNKGSYSGDTTHQGHALFARGAAPALSFVETAMVGSAGFGNTNDPLQTWNAAGITRAGFSIFSPQQVLFAQEYGAVPSSMGCHGRKLNGYDAGSFPPVNWWDPPLNWGSTQPLLSSGWSNGAPGADNDGTWRAGYEKIDTGSCPNAPTCNGTCQYQWTDTGNGASLRLGGGSTYNNGQNLMKGEVYEVIMWSLSALTNNQDVKNVEAYLAAKYYLNCGAAYSDASMYNYSLEACAGGGADAPCHVYCSSGFTRVAGAYNNMACIAGKWHGFQLGAYQTFGRQSCLPVCPLLLAPANLDASGAGCLVTRFSEALGPDPLRPGWELRSFTSWPHFPDAFLAQKFFTASDAASGGYAVADSTFRRLDDPAGNGLGRDSQITLFVSSSATSPPRRSRLTRPTPCACASSPAARVWQLASARTRRTRT
jgi:hypothetical protein